MVVSSMRTPSRLSGIVVRQGLWARLQHDDASRIVRAPSRYRWRVAGTRTQLDNLLLVLRAGSRRGVVGTDRWAEAGSND